jgi:gliding motility-associated-like protein
LPAADCTLDADLSASTIPCNANTGSLTLTAIQGLAPFEYSLFQGGNLVSNGSLGTLNTPLLINGLAPGSYSLNLLSANGQSITIQANIVQLPSPILSIEPGASINGYAIQCAGDTDGSAEAMVTSGVPPYAFLWSQGSTTANADGLGAGTYFVTISDANGCVVTSSITLNEPPPLSISFEVNNLSCFANQNGAILVKTLGGVEPFSYVLGNTTQNSNLFSNLTAGAYTVTTIDANSCQQSEIIVVNAAIPVTIDLGDDQTIELGGETVLQAIVNIPFDSILTVSWTPPQDSLECEQCLEYQVAPFISTTYSVQITALNGCTDSDQVTIIVDRRKFLYVPNVFSPNFDGQNDLFLIYGKPGTVRRFKSFQIFDRWGELVFSKDNFSPDDNFGWDGSFNGKTMPPGVYVWYVDVEFSDGENEVFKGDVTIFR